MNHTLNSSEISDQEIIQRVLSGEIDVYQIIVHRYNAYLYKIGRSYGYNHADVEDLMQETYVKAYINLTAFEYRSSFLTWITRIMLNNCYHKKKKFSWFKEQSTNSIEDKTIPMFNSNQSSSTRILNNELKNILENAILHIPESYRSVFTLRELNGMSVKETAEVLQLSESNIKVRLNRAKSMLQKEISKSYSPQEIFEFNLIYCDKMVDRVMHAIKNLEINAKP